MYRTQFSYKNLATGIQTVEINAGVDGKTGIDAATVSKNLYSLLEQDGKTVKVLSIAVQPVPVAPAAPVK